MNFSSKSMKTFKRVLSKRGMALNDILLGTSQYAAAMLPAIAA